MGQGEPKRLVEDELALPLQLVTGGALVSSVCLVCSVYLVYSVWLV